MQAVKCAAHQPSTGQTPTVWVMTVEPVDIGKYVQLVSELASDRFCAPARAADYSKYKVRDKELGRC
jgi:hypothetical protein